jgi:hypothetical protein
MKNINKILTPRLLAAAIASAALITPAIVFAQDAPAYSDGASQQIQGTIAAINGTWNINVADANGYSDSVELHQGTIINPTGLTLEPGMNVTIDGYADGPNFDAMEIDTPYQYQGPAPVAVYYGPGAWYPGYANGWGPSFSLAFSLNTRSFVQRPFFAGGEIRRAETPPSGWQNQPHGFIGNTGNAGNFHRTAFNAPQQQRSFAAPQQQTRSFAAPPQQARTFAAPPQQARTFAAPPQQARTFAAPPQQARTFAAPPQQARTFAAPPQQARTFAAPPQQARTFAAPPQQARSFSAPPQQARSFSAPPARAAAAAPAAPRGRDNGGDHRRG